VNYARSSTLRDELDYWCGTRSYRAVRLPLDYPDGTNTTASARTVSVSLNAGETDTLLHKVPTAFRTQINEVLLAALVRAFGQWTGSDSLLVDLEGHGREEILEGVDLSRTVGWFTTIFPVLLDRGNSQTTVDALLTVKEQLRIIPNRGIGYGLLRYLNDDGVAKKLRDLPQAEVRLNYLGQVDRALLDSSMFKVATHPTGPAQSPKAARVYLVNIIGSVSAGELRLAWTYSENIHRSETIERLAQNYLNELRELIAQSQSGEKLSFSPSDFPNANLSQADLRKVLDRISGKRTEN
jgi:non-ribosomal peptide synthase protein (TIGR01720 family)